MSNVDKIHRKKQIIYCQILIQKSATANISLKNWLGSLVSWNYKLIYVKYLLMKWKNMT